MAKDFIMNNKCSAGTNRFLEVMANILGVRPDALCELASILSAKLHSYTIRLWSNSLPKQKMLSSESVFIRRKQKERIGYKEQQPDQCSPGP